LFRRAAKIDLVYVPYKSESLAFPDLVGGQISAMFVYTGGGVPLITSGKIRALAVAASNRNPAIPTVPTFIEEGYGSVQFYVHGLILGPAGTPRDVASTLHRELAEIMNEPDVIRSYESTGAEPSVGSADEAAALIQHELATSAAIVKELGVTLE
jgi:tripartite-type tricarboxylate transporter receptor subunit TctC